MQMFKFEGIQLRTMDLEGKPHFVGIDVARALMYANPSKAVIDHCKGVSKLGIPSDGGTQETNVIPEGDVYRLIVKAADQSRNEVIKENAERFERVVFDEILPSIRKHGAYMTSETIEKTLTDPDFIIGLANRLKEEQLARVKAEADKFLLQEEIKLQAPKVALYDTAMNANNNMTMMAVAKSLKIGRNKLFALLREKKVIMLNNLPYQSYIDRGYFEVRQYTITHFTSGLENKTQTMVTPKGMAWIHTILTAMEA